MTKALNKFRLIDFSLKSIFFKQEKKKATPSVELIHTLDTYTVKITIPEYLKDDISYLLKGSFIHVKAGCSQKKINFPEPVDTDKVRSYYQQGIFFIEIPKLRETPFERINRIALNYV